MRYRTTTRYNKSIEMYPKIMLPDSKQVSWYLSRVKYHYKHYLHLSRNLCLSK